MQIHELNTFSGKPGETDFLAIDTGFDTAKISAKRFLETKVNRPIDEHNQYTDGTAGQLLRSKGDGSTEWSDVGQPTDEQTAQAISDWLDTHPEATTTVQDGAITKAKLSDALKYKMEEDPTMESRVLASVFDYIGIITNDSADVTSLQGCAYNPNKDEYVVAIVSSDNYSKCMLVTIDMSDGLSIKKRSNVVDAVLGHANDIAYNPNTNKYYITTGSQGTYKNQVAVVDADTLEYEESYQLSPITSDSNYCNWVIDYDAVNDRYITASYYKIQEYNADFELLAERNFANTNSVIGLFSKSTPIVQAGCLYDENMLLILHLFHVNAEDEYDGLALSFYDVESGVLLRSETIDCIHFNDEPEGIFIKDGIVYIVDGQPYFTLRQVVPHDYVVGRSGNDIFNIGRQLHAGDDLNDFKIVGKYTSASSVISRQIANAPITSGGFSLWVMNQAYNNIVQLAISNNEDIKIRTFQTNSNTWTDWNVTHTSDIYDASDNKVGTIEYFRIFGTNLFFATFSVTLGSVSTSAVLNGFNYSDLQTLKFNIGTLSSGRFTLSNGGGGMYGIGGVGGTANGVAFRLFTAGASIIGTPVIVGTGTFRLS